MKIVIQTQYSENYGAHSWNGKGECPQYWKNKGGSEYIITDVPMEWIVENSTKLHELVTKAVEAYEWSHFSDYSHEVVIDWTIEEDSYVPYDEKLQMEFSGHVTYPAVRKTFGEVQAA